MNLTNLLEKAENKACQLNPYLHDKCLQLVKLAYENGYEILVTQCYRSIEEQNALYAQGRTKPGQIVTNAKGGSSNHNYRLAFDIVILDANGNMDWNCTDKYKAVGELGQSIGLDWGGAWTSFLDLPHFEYTYGLSIGQLRNGIKIPDYPTGYSKEEEFDMSKEEAEFILSVMGDYWTRMDGNEPIQNEIHRVANILRKAVGIPEE